MPTALDSASLHPDPIPARVYRGLITVGSYLKSPLLLAMRLYWGWQLIVSARGHLSNVPQMVQNFKDWGIPLPTLNVYMSAGVEMIGGMLLILGLASRLIAIPLIGNFVVAYLTASIDTVKNIFHNPDAFVSDAAFLFLLTAVLVFVFGPGLFSVDAILERTVFRKYSLSIQTRSRSASFPEGVRNAPR